MARSIVIDALKSYVSSLLVEQAYQTAQPDQDASLVRQAATVLFTDVSGFTSLTEQFAQQGSAGVEMLTEHLNAYFGELIELIYAHGGDVIKFVGDALLCLWPAGADGDRNAALALATHRAAQCALAMQAQLNQYRIEGKPLLLRVALGSGDVTIALVGSSSGHREIIVGGPPLVAMATAERQAHPGEVVLAQRTWELLGDNGIGTPVSANGIRLEALHQHLPLAPVLVPEISAGQVDTLLTYLPQLIQVHLQTGQTQWLSELRRITVVFVNLPSLDYETADILGLLQRIMAGVQQILQQYEGVLNKFLVEDKGSIILMGFGLPPYAHEDDAIRGVQAAIALLDHLQQLGLQTHIGVTTGRCYCGAIGSDRRREYSVLGDTVNLAARLMQVSSDGILCDETTYLMARSQLVFESLPAIQVKGKTHPIPIYQPNEAWSLSHALQMQVLSTQSYSLPESEMVGRQPQQQILAAQLGRLQQGQGGVVLIEGEPGIGKSQLLSAFLRYSQASQVQLLAGAGIAIIKNKPYHAWCSILIRLLQLNPLAPVEQQRQQFLAWLATQPQAIQHRGALLTPMLPFDVPDTEQTQALTGPERSEATRNLVVELLQNATQMAPTILVLDDVHWLDAASWALLLAVSEAVTSVLTVVATRPVDAAVGEYERLRQLTGLKYLHLAPLSSQETLALVRRRLGVNALPHLVVQLLQKAQGNPFFCEELAYSLRDRGLIVITPPDCRLATGVTDFDTVSIPDTIEGLVTSRIDRLGSEQQLTLKVASVIGRIFPYTILHDVYPVVSEKSQLPDHLKTLEAFDLAYLHRPEPDLSYSFRHITTQEVAYNLMLFAQRRQLHQHIAEWHERTYDTHLVPFYSLLAHHWSRADHPAKAADYFAKAGKQAVYDGANADAIAFFNAALDWLQQLPESPARQTQELQILIALGAPLTAIKGYGAPEIVDTFTRARRLAQSLGETPDFFPMLWGLFAAHIGVADLKTAGELAEELLTLAESSQDPAFLLSAYHAIGAVRYFQGQLMEARSHFEQGVAIYTPQLHDDLTFTYGQNPGIACISLLSMVLWLLGEYDPALMTAQDALARAQTADHPFTLSLVSLYVACTYQCQQDAPAALAQTQFTQTLSVEMGFALWLPLTDILEGWSKQQLDDLKGGLAQMQQGLSNYLKTDHKLERPYYMMLVVTGYLQVGQGTAGLALVEQALDLTDETGARYWLPELHRLKGELLQLTAGDAAIIETCFRDAIAIARQQQAKALEERALWSMTRFQAQQQG